MSTVDALAFRPHITSGEHVPASLLLQRRAARFPSMWTADALAAADFPPIHWAVPDLIPEGLTVLAGRPKLGKSWLALCLARALASGGCALGEKPIPAPQRVLYLALEDTPRRLQDRLRALGDAVPANLHLCLAWQRGAEGMAQLEDFLTDYPDTRLIVIDTWQKIRDPRAGNGSRDAYAETYGEADLLKALADRYHLAVLLIYHTRKDGDFASGDFLDSVLGSTGLTGAADTVAVLTRKRGKHDAVLHLAGRDLPQDLELALRQDPHIGWKIVGDAEEYALSQSRQQILEALDAADDPLKPRQIAEMTGLTEANVRQALGRMVAQGLIGKADYGKYQRPCHTSHSSHTSDISARISTKSVTGPTETVTLFPN